MKTSVKIIIGAGLFVLLAGTIGISIHHHYGHRSMKGTAYYHKQGMDQRHIRGRNREAYMPMMRGMRPGMERGPMNGVRRGRGQGQLDSTGRGMGQGPMNGMRRGMGPGQMNGMGRGMRRMPMNRMAYRNMVPGMMMGNIPNLSDKQKKEIADLRQQQMDEIKKIRDEMTTKMQGLRETHRKKIMDLLTPEQKKFVESQTRVTEPPLSK